MSNSILTAELAWEGDSLEVLKRFPESVRRELGFALRKLQTGEVPTNVITRSMSSIGKGVFELKESDERTWYRVVYLSKIDGVIYVLHSFEKDSKKTDKRDIGVAKMRLSKVLERIVAQRKEVKKGVKNVQNKK